MMALFVSREDHLKPILNLRTIVLFGVRLRGSVFLGLVPMLRYHGLGIKLFCSGRGLIDGMGCSFIARNQVPEAPMPPITPTAPKP